MNEFNACSLHYVVFRSSVHKMQSILKGLFDSALTQHKNASLLYVNYEEFERKVNVGLK